MKVSSPIKITFPAYGVSFAESVHAPDFQMAVRNDPYHKVIYVLRGRVAYRDTDRRFLADEGGVWFVPKNVQHGISDEAPSVLLLLCLTDEFIQADADLPSLWSGLAKAIRRHVTLNRPGREKLERIWRQGILEKRESRAGAGLMVRSLATQALTLLARLQPDFGGTTLERVDAVTHEIRDTFYDEWSLDRAAVRAGVSRRRFSALFHQVNGKTFGEFLTECRLGHAAQLLQGGESSVFGAMFSSGFNDVSHFYRLFRRRYGCAPATWAKRQSA